MKTTHLAHEMRAVLYDAEQVDVITSSLEALALLVTVTNALAQLGERDPGDVARQIEAAARRCLVQLDGASLRGDRAEGET